jgi:hypothetical protein
MNDPSQDNLAVPNIWTTKKGRLALLICPKAGCSTLAQFLYYSQAGTFWDAEIHEEELSIEKWPQGDCNLIRQKVLSPETLVVSTVRNPYLRLLSAFFDKIASPVSTYFDSSRGPQEYYRGEQLDPWKEKYGFGPCQPKEQIASFERFLECLWDLFQESEPQTSKFWDGHWLPLYPIIEDLISKRGRLDYLIRCENLTIGLRELAWQVQLEHVPDFEKMPRFNPSRMKKAFAEEDYFRSPAAQEIVQSLFWEDFEAFEYPLTPARMREVLPPIDLARLHQRLGASR